MPLSHPKRFREIYQFKIWKAPHTLIFVYPHKKRRRTFLPDRIGKVLVPTSICWSKILPPFNEAAYKYSLLLLSLLTYVSLGV
jgi:hypothetical protein